MAKIKVNSLVEFDVEQIKVSGIMYVVLGLLDLPKEGYLTYEL